MFWCPVHPRVLVDQHQVHLQVKELHKDLDVRESPGTSESVLDLRVANPPSLLKVP